MNETANVFTLTPVDGSRSERQVPFNAEAERGLLGTLMIDNSTYDDVGDRVKPETFYFTAHQKIFEAIVALIDRGQVADPTTLIPYFEAEPEFLIKGTTPREYIANLVASAPNARNVETYADHVIDSFDRRRLIDVLELGTENAYHGDIELTAADVIEGVEQGCLEIADGTSSTAIPDFKTRLLSTINELDRAHRQQGMIGAPTGLTDLDKHLGGLAQPDLIILAGRPAMGKTTAGAGCAMACARAFLTEREMSETERTCDAGPVAIFSFEMSAEQLTAKYLASETGVSVETMRKGEMNQEQFSKVARAANDMHKLPVFIDDTANLTVAGIRTRARRLKRKHGLGLLVVDYLQLIRDPNEKDGRVQEVSNITRQLKILAKELRVPVLALSQLSRKVEEREDKRPHLADLRESGSIEQDADIVMFLFREEYYLELARPQPREGETEASEKYAQRLISWQDRLDRVAGKSEIIIAKNRHGPTGTITVAFQGAQSRFVDLAPDHHQQSFV